MTSHKVFEMGYLSLLSLTDRTGIPMGIARMRQQCIPGRFFLPRKKWPGNEARQSHTEADHAISYHACVCVIPIGEAIIIRTYPRALAASGSAVASTKEGSVSRI